MILRSALSPLKLRGRSDLPINGLKQSSKTGTMETDRDVTDTKRNGNQLLKQLHCAGLRGACMRSQEPTSCGLMSFPYQQSDGIEAYAAIFLASQRP